MEKPDIFEAEKTEWIQGPSERSRMKTFFSPSLPDCFTLLIDVPPGETLARHEEPLFEVGYVLSGSCTCGEGAEYPAGTFFFSPKGVTHGPFRSAEGCLLLCFKFDR
ncbi:MAG: cupin domain-containing protein [bacterium]